MRLSFVKVLYGSRPADAVMSTRKHNDLLVFETQARTPTHVQACCCLLHSLDTADVNADRIRCAYLGPRLRHCWCAIALNPQLRCQRLDTTPFNSQAASPSEAFSPMSTAWCPTRWRRYSYNRSSTWCALGFELQVLLNGTDSHLAQISLLYDVFYHNIDHLVR